MRARLAPSNRRHRLTSDAPRHSPLIHRFVARGRAARARVWVETRAVPRGRVNHRDERSIEFGDVTRARAHGNERDDTTRDDESVRVREIDRIQRWTRRASETRVGIRAPIERWHGDERVDER